MTNQMTNEEAGAILEAFNQDETLDALWFTYKQRKAFSEALDMAINSLKQQPKTGQWIAEINDYGEITHWHCDKCYEDSGFTTTCKWDFCPSCGTKMIEPQESEVEE